MITYIKKLIVKRKQRKEIKLIIKYIKFAKKYYIKCINNNTYIGMCLAFNHASLNKQYCDKYRIIKHIPEFNAKFLNGNSNEAYWWRLKDTKSRIEAFDKLIKVYENKLKVLSKCNIMS